MGNSGVFNRNWILKRLQVYLRLNGSPRFQMSLMVSGTALAGFLASVVMLHYGLHTMSLRYGIAVLAAYAGYLVFLYMWILFHRFTLRSAGQEFDTWDSFDVADVLLQISSGGDHPRYEVLESETSREKSLLDFIDMDFDEGVVLLTILAVFGSVLAASVYIIYMAPVLLAELMLDGVLGIVLYRRLRTIDQHYWLGSALSRTWMLFVCAALVFALTGEVFHWYAPDAVSIGGVWHQYLTNHPQ